MLNFEDNIRRNRSHFDKHEPETGHKIRFANRLKESGFKKESTINSANILRIAATIVIFITAGFVLTYFLKINNVSNDSIVQSIEYSQDMNDILSYYDEVSSEKANEIYEFITDSEEAEHIKTKALNRLNDIDGSLALIEKEFIKNPEDENIKSALINNKRKKVEVMDNILTQLDFTNTSFF